MSGPLGPPAQKSQGLRVVYSKNFSRATFFVFWGTHLVDLELFARETNLEKKRSVSLSAKVKTLQPFSWFWYYNIPTCLISTIHTLIYPCYGDAWRAISQLVCTAKWAKIAYEGASLISLFMRFHKIFFLHFSQYVLFRNLVKQAHNKIE